MKQITNVEELQKIELDILIFVDKVCRENNINYSIAYGTALGAVRHGGFIPWDDDVDIMMTTENYNKFIQVMKNRPEKERYKCLFFGDENPNYFYLIAKVVDTETFVKETDYMRNENYGVWLDIFPMSNVPEDNEKFLKLNKKFKKYMLLSKISAQEKFMPSAKNSKFSRFIKSLAYPFIRMTGYKMWNKKAQKVANSYAAQNTGKVFSFCSDEIATFNTTDILNTTNINFAGHNFLIVKDYDAYLKAIYGDYMTPPPEDMRVSNHSFVAFWKEKS